MIRRGMFHLAKSAAGNDITAYHLQAGIAAIHCTAKDYRSTDWRQILALYDRLVEIDNSPVVALNRAVALAQVCGPRAGIEAIESFRHARARIVLSLLRGAGGVRDAVEEFRRRGRPSPQSH
ncbi:MAG: hypothetical protein FJ398_16990 [Verrucomicrobia bacterium]|nr:hypothetical protein [Verrucomicrobiota bacterium]